MKLDRKMARLICELEYCIGSTCYNPNSYDGWTGEEGRSFRYPVNLKAKKDDNYFSKTRLNVVERYPRAGVEAVNTMRYEFGSNHIYIGKGIKRLLEELEDRYGLDFNKLEEERRSKK